MTPPDQVSQNASSIDGSMVENDKEPRTGLLVFFVVLIGAAVAGLGLSGLSHSSRPNATTASTANSSSATTNSTPPSSVTAGTTSTSIDRSPTLKPSEGIVNRKPASTSRPTKEFQLAGNWTEPNDSHGLRHLWRFNPNGSFISQSQGGRGSLVKSGSWEVSGKSVLLEGKIVIFTGSTVRHGGFSDELELIDATSLRRINGSILIKNR